MLPKFATNLFGHFPRSSGTFRQGFFNSTTASSGGNAGGAKYNAGGRFYNSGYNGYTGAGRAVTQANNLGGDDETHPRLQRVSYIQRTVSTSSYASGLPPHPHFRTSTAANAQRVRRNSTSTATASEVERDASSSAAASLEPPVPPQRATTPTPEQLVTTAERLDVDPSTPQSVLPPSPSLSPKKQSKKLKTPSRPSSPAYTAANALDASLGEDAIPGYGPLHTAFRSKSYHTALRAVSNYRTFCEKHTVAGYNMALAALLETRQYIGGEHRMPGWEGDRDRGSLKDMLETYNEMIGPSRGLVPNIRTYKVLLMALTQRDVEVQRAIVVLRGRIEKRTKFGEKNAEKANEREEGYIDALRKEDNFSSALMVFAAASSLSTRPKDQEKGTTRGLDMGVYTSLLRSCALHGAVDPAIRVFAHMERYALQKPGMSIYRYLIETYRTAGDIDGAKEVFEEYRRIVKEKGEEGLEQASMEKDNDFTKLYADVEGGRSGLARITQVQLWNEMIGALFSAPTSSPSPNKTQQRSDPQPEAALALLEEMLDTPHGLQFGVADPPLPSGATYTTVIQGFIGIGDVNSAYTWFERMVRLGVDPEEKEWAGLADVPILKTPKPNGVAWKVMLDALMTEGGKTSIERLNGLWKILVQLESEGKAPLFIHGMDRYNIVKANADYITNTQNGSITYEEKRDIVDFLKDSVVSFCPPSSDNEAPGLELLSLAANASMDILNSLLLDLQSGKDERYNVFAKELMVEYARMSGKASEEMQSGGERIHLRRRLHECLNACLGRFLGADPGVPAVVTDLREALDIVNALVGACGHYCNEGIARYVTRLYLLEKKAQDGVAPTLTNEQWSALVHLGSMAYTRKSVWAESTLPTWFVQLGDGEGVIPIRELVQDLPVRDFKDPHALKELVQAVFDEMGITDGTKFLKEAGHPFVDLLQSGFVPSIVNRTPKLPTKSENDDISVLNLDYQEPAVEVIIDAELSRSIDEYHPSHRHLTAYDGMKRFELGLKRGVYPHAEVIGRLINSLGRLKETGTLKVLYDHAQTVLSSMAGDREKQSLAWFQIEDQMCIGWAHAGDLQAAHVHRDRILQHGGAPSADAYGALISGIRDTTDDVSTAMSLWHESQEHRVRPNLFLYNTVISRLAKARKAEQALELFGEMKAANVQPSTVTYGAVITACCRVGDAESAETLFEEMEASKRYVPRVPPFNTIIQLFVTTRPNREKVEKYYALMNKERVNPSDHTYKLLLDAYGTIEPVDLSAMEATFAKLQNDPRVKVNGTHWAALINAYGCGQKDLEKAQQIFDGIEHASTSRNPSKPDAIAYEAMFNVLVTHHRADLFGEYIGRMKKHNVHMTAYIANLLIKGYSITGDIWTARATFEMLSDPPIGVAAPNNHVSHRPSAGSEMPISADAPVFREPSTWEAMVRAELGNNNRQGAVDLIQRMQTRGYPPAVLLRVSGIIHSDLEQAPATPNSSPATLNSPISNQSTFGSSTAPSSVS